MHAGRCWAHSFCVRTARFGDIQRIQPSGLSLSARALRGICWATKTTNQGQPFACRPFGLMGVDISTSWLVKWLDRDAFQPDFILPCMPDLTSRPMSYLQALVCLRWAIQLPWLPEGGQLVTQQEAGAFTLHSLQCTLLSAAAQLRLPEESRRLQGHRRLLSALLYSRDDTIEALWLQLELALAIRQGWRPPRPMARGGQHPTVEPASGRRRRSHRSKSLPSSITRFLYLREVEGLLGQHAGRDEEALAVEQAALVSSEAESESNHLSPFSEEAEPSQPSTQNAELIGVRLMPWGAVHALTDTHAQSTLTVCGLQIKNLSFAVQEIRPDMQLCQRKACLALLGRKRPLHSCAHA